VGRDYNKIKKATSMSLIIGRTNVEVEEKIRKRAKNLKISVEEVKDQIGLGFGSPEKIVEGIKEYSKIGIDLITLRYSNLEDLQLFSKDISDTISRPSLPTSS